MNDYEQTQPLPARKLVALGGLAALALNPEVRRSLVGGTRSGWAGARHTVKDTVVPALAGAAHQVTEVASSAAQHTQQVAHEATRLGGAALSSTLSTLREEAPGRAEELRRRAATAATELAGAAQDRAATLTQEAQKATAHAAKMAEQRRKQAQKQARRQARHLGRRAQQDKSGALHALADVKDAGLGLAGNVAGSVAHNLHSLLETAGRELDRDRRDAYRVLAAARRDAERDLRRRRKNWDPAKLERMVQKRVAPVQKRVDREFARLDRQVARQKKQARAQDQGGGLGGLTTLALLGTGAVVLARVPAARRGLISAVEAVSPESAQTLHRLSRQARNLIGEFWLEDLEAPGGSLALVKREDGAAVPGDSRTGQPGAHAGAPVTAEMPEQQDAETEKAGKRSLDA